jgi:hypothetical protein
MASGLLLGRGSNVGSQRHTEFANPRQRLRRRLIVGVIKKALTIDSPRYGVEKLE